MHKFRGFFKNKSCEKTLFFSHKGLSGFTETQTLLTNTVPWTSSTVFVKKNVSSFLPWSIVTTHLPFLLHAFPHLFARKTKCFKGFRNTKFFLLVLSFPAKRYTHKYQSGYKGRIDFSFTLKIGNFYEKDLGAKIFAVTSFSNWKLRRVK